jgi:hypothetical protein
MFREEGTKAWFDYNSGVTSNPKAFFSKGWIAAWVKSSSYLIDRINITRCPTPREKPAS